MAGRLTLSWVGKEKSLISDGGGGYRWVDPDDMRTREVRILEPVSLVGDARGTPDDNLLIRGDGLDAMRALAHIPEYARTYRGKVKLVYIDPPFNTGQAFEHYDDALEHSIWLGMMRERLVAIQELLAPDGSVWVHLDDAEMAYCKVLMDEVFGRSNFVATVVWQRTNSPRNSAQFMSSDTDFILVYAHDVAALSLNMLGRTDEMDAKFRNPDGDERGPWFAADLSARNFYSKGTYVVTAPGGKRHGPGAGRYWAISEENMRALDVDGRIWWGASRNNKPTRKLFLDDVRQGRVPSTMWPPEEVGYVRNGKQETKSLLGGEPFATPKPERLLERVLAIGSNPGDIVLDAFAGSGTTAAVAHKMGRRWVTIEQQDSTVDTFTRPRLEKVVNGEDPGGVTDATGWLGGGGFSELRVAPPIAEVVDAEPPTVTVVDLQTEPGRIERSIAAQLGYELDGDPATSAKGAVALIGRKGRSRLSVIRGVADAGLVALLVSELAPDELLVLAAPMVAPGAREALSAAAPGSRIVRYPRELYPAGAVR
jgi:adenine-specific DNA-methyltransferase